MNDQADQLEAQPAVARCSVRKCNRDALVLDDSLPICALHLPALPVNELPAPTLLDVLITLMMSDSVDDLQAAIDMTVEIIGLVPLEGTYAGGWTANDLLRFGLEQEASDATNL